jgi:hypothetical protein
MELAFSNDECLKLQLPRFSHTNGPPPSLFKIWEMLWMVFHPNLTNNSFFVPCSHFFPLYLRRREIRNVNWIRSQALYDAIFFSHSELPTSVTSTSWNVKTYLRIFVFNIYNKYYLLFPLFTLRIFWYVPLVSNVSFSHPETQHRDPENSWYLWGTQIGAMCGLKKTILVR